MRAGTASIAIVGFVTAVLAGGVLAAEPPAALVLERTIPLPNVSGRIDHLGVDLARKRLFVAELGNQSVDVIDLAAARPLERISGLREPQAVAYVASSDRIVVSDGGDGAVRVFHAADLSAAGAVAVGEDADDIRVDPQSGQVLVGYGTGGLAIVDPVGPSRLADIPLPVHPEAFELDRAGQRILVNLPGAREIGVVDLRARRQVGHWSVAHARSNFPMALDPGDARLAVVFRHPPELDLLDARDGAAVTAIDTCGDADDVFFDAGRRRVYVSCGEGAVDVFATDAAAVRRIQRVVTRPGARTSLFVPELDRLFVAARAAASGSDAAILVFRPIP